MTQADSQYIDGRTGPWEIVIGLEIHAQVVSEAKLFSGAATRFGAAPNAQVSLVDAAMPGMLPVINMECVRQAVRTGLGINAEINLGQGAAALVPLDRRRAPGGEGPGRLTASEAEGARHGVSIEAAQATHSRGTV